MGGSSGGIKRKNKKCQRHPEISAKCWNWDVINMLIIKNILNVSLIGLPVCIDD